MSNAKFTLFGCEKYFITQNQSLFDNLNVPTGITKSTLVDNIMLRGGEFEVQYGDPDFLRAAIGSWSNKWMPTMQRWVDALAIEYAPLENYDRIEDWTDNTARSDASSETSTSNRTLDRDEASAHDESEAQNTSSSENTSDSATYSQSDAKQSAGTNDVDNTFDRDKWNSPPTHTTTKSAYDSSTYQPYTQETDTGKWQEKSEGSTTSNESSASSSNSSGSSSNSASGSSSKAGSSTGTNTIDETDTMTAQNDLSSAMNNDSVHSGRIHGNIGVTTSQQMLLQELDLGYWNIYEKVTELFLQEFTIPVYL